MERVGKVRELGNAVFRAGDWAGAIAHYSDAIRLCDGIRQPSGLEVLYCNRAAAHLKLGHGAAALRDAEVALAAKPKWAKALYRKAAALQRLGQPAAATAALQQALALEPGNKEAQALLQQLGVETAAAASGAAATTTAVSSQGQAALGHRKPAPTAAVLPPILATAPWEYVPAPDGIDENLLLMLHALGDRPSAFAQLARQMALPQTAALALGGPQAVPFSEGGRSWYTVFTDDFQLIEGRPGEQRRVRSLQVAVAALQHLLGKLQQGGTVALELARQQQVLGQPLGSCVAVAAALLPEQLAQGLGAGSGGGCVGTAGAGQHGSTAVLITHGSADKVVAWQSVEQTAAALQNTHSMEVVVHVVPGKGHGMPQGPAEMRWLMEFWATHLSRHPSAADMDPEVVASGGEVLEVKPGEVSIELLGQQQH